MTSLKLTMTSLSPCSLRRCVSLVVLAGLLSFLFCPPTVTAATRRPGSRTPRQGRVRRKWQEGDVRLVRGRSRSEGVVLLYHQGRWGGVCDDMWDVTASDVVCRQRGFPGSARPALKTEFGARARRRLWITRVQCKGTEKRLLDCAYVGWGRRIRHMCTGDWRAVGVVCRPKIRKNKNNTNNKRNKKPRPRRRQSWLERRKAAMRKANTKKKAGKLQNGKRTGQRSKDKSSLTGSIARSSGAVSRTKPGLTEDRNAVPVLRPFAMFDAPPRRGGRRKPTTARPDARKRKVHIQPPTTTASATTTSTTRATTTTTKPSSTTTTTTSTTTSTTTTKHTTTTTTPSTTKTTTTATTTTTTPTTTTTTPTTTTTTPTTTTTTPTTTTTTTTTPTTTTTTPTTTTTTTPTSTTTTTPTTTTTTTPTTTSTTSTTTPTTTTTTTTPTATTTTPTTTTTTTRKPTTPQPTTTTTITTTTTKSALKPTTTTSATIHSKDSATEEEKEEEEEEADTVAQKVDKPKLIDLSKLKSSGEITLKDGELQSKDALLLQADSPGNPDLELRVEGGRYAWEGRLEVRERARVPGEWGTVCGASWGIRETMVVCRELGLNYAKQPLQTNYFGGQDKVKVYHSFNCTGRESKLSECTVIKSSDEYTCPKVTMVAGVVCATYLPDLIPDLRRLSESVRLQDRPLYYLQCALEENCLSSSAYELKNNSRNWRNALRRLLRFSTIVHNRGDADFRPYVNKGQWQWHTCHMHFHSMEVFAHYDIMDENGTRLAEGSKASFCLEDTVCDRGVSRQFQCAGFGDQGLSVNCSDNYLWDIDCQWIDITDIAPGTYTFLLEVNPQMLVAELNFDNNIASCDLYYSGYFAKLSNCQHKSLLDYWR